MKLLISLSLIGFWFFGPGGNEKQVNNSATSLPSFSIQAIATVIDGNSDYMNIEIEQVTAYGKGISVLPTEGNQITVKLPGREMPKIESRIEIELHEKVEVGAVPNSYIMLNYRTIE